MAKRPRVPPNTPPNVAYNPPYLVGKKITPKTGPALGGYPDRGTLLRGGPVLISREPPRCFWDGFFGT